MKTTKACFAWLSLAALALLLTPAAQAQGQAQSKMVPLPTNLEAVDRAISADNLRAVAANTEDPEVLLGLTYLAQTGDPVRAELAGRAVAAKPEYAPIVAVLAVMMDGANDQTVAALLERDPENALGHYLNGLLLYESEKDAEAHAAFQKAVALRGFRLYLDETSSALFKALDALDLHGRDRLAALSWIATTGINFGVLHLQELPSALGGAARRQAANKDEIGDMLLVLAGHLALTNHEYRNFGHRALMSAFRQKAEAAAADGSPTMHGYATATQALIGALWGLGEFSAANEYRDVSRFLPGRIHSAFAWTGPREAELYKRNVPDFDRPEFERARQQAKDAAAALIAAAEKAPDEIVGAYLRGMPPPPQDAEMPWVPQWTYVDQAMERYPDVYETALRREEAIQALQAAGASDPRQKNLSNLMRLGLAAIAYSQKHDNQLPPNVEVLYEQKLLDPEIQPKSLLSGRPYVFLAAGQRLPEKSHEFDVFILFYDDQEIDGEYQSAMADGSGARMPVERVRAQRGAHHE